MALKGAILYSIFYYSHQQIDLSPRKINKTGLMLYSVPKPLLKIFLSYALYMLLTINVFFYNHEIKFLKKALKYFVKTQFDPYFLPVKS